VRVKDIAPEILDWTERLHAVASELGETIARGHGARLRCRSGCADCCADGLTVFEIEAAVIARRHADLLASGDAHPEGGCAFLGPDRECRIYASRPYVCRTQGLPLRWLENDDDGPVEARDICPLNADGGPALEDLDPEACWTIGPFEERLAERQASVDGGAGRRIALRSLFASGDATRRRLPTVK
jgi:hypothetical protein